MLRRMLGVFLILVGSGLALTETNAAPIYIDNSGGAADFQLKLWQTDDVMTASITNSAFTDYAFASMSFGYGPNYYDFTSYVREGDNTINLKLVNGPSGYTMGWAILVSGNTVASFACGNFNTFGCNGDSYASGQVYNEDVTLSVVGPASPVPLPAALPLMAGGLGGMGFISWWKRRNTARRLAC